MNLRETLLAEHSRAQTQKIVDYIGKDQARFDALLEIFLYAEYRLVQRAAWVIGHAAHQHPQLLQPHLSAVFENLRRPGIHDAVKRNTLRVLIKQDIPEELWGEAADICFGFVQSGYEPVAVKVHSMVVLMNITRKLPELGYELRGSIEALLPEGTAGIRSRGKKILKELDKMGIH
ncbi:MAG: hypothetical protein AAF206_05320 [Bacteroidota bacterium]